MASVSRRQALRAALGAGAAVAAGGLATAARAVDAGSPPAGPTPLSAAIRAFNAEARQNEIGRDQPPLTEEEVVAAIRWWQLDRNEAPVTDEEFAAFRRIADTRELPPGAEFEVLTGFQPNDEFVFTRWSVRIVMPRTAAGKSGWTYAYVVRDRAIRSRRIGPEERKVIDRWEKRIREQGGIGSFERVEYGRERAAAVERDQGSPQGSPPGASGRSPR